MNKIIHIVRTLIMFIIILAASALYTSHVHAGPAFISYQDYSQPSGEHFSATLNGDEWKHWVSTDHNEVVVQQDDSYWYYAKIENGNLLAGSARYGIDAPPAIIVTSQDVVTRVVSKTPKVNNLEQGTTGFKSLSITRPQFSTSPQGTPIKTAHDLSTPHKLLVLLVGFTGTAIQNTDTVWSNQFFGAANSVNSYYKEVSNNQFYFTPAAESSGTLNDGVIRVALNYAHPNPGGNTGTANQKIVKDALTAANASINFASYDLNGDGYISTDELHVVTIVAGKEASFGGPSPSVWGHHWSLFGANPPVTLDSKIIGDASKLGGYVQVGEMQGTHMATIGILCHELGHDLGLPDLYDTNNSTGGLGLGIHSLMASGSWGRSGSNFPGSSPTHFDAWSRMFLGFTAAPEASLGGTTTLNASAGDVYRISTTSPTEYFLIENREPDNGYDAGLYNDVKNGGIAIYHIDEAVISANFNSNTVNNNATHKGVQIIEANKVAAGLSQLDTSASGLHIFDDYYTAGGYATFNTSTNPSSDLYIGSPSGVIFTATSAFGNAMTAQVQAVGMASNASLSGLTLSQGSLNPKFTSGQTAYNATLPGSVTSITVTPNATAAAAVVKVNGVTVASGTASGATNLNLGTNAITIGVTSSDGTATNTYNLTVTRSQGVEVTYVALNLKEVELRAGGPKVTLTAAITPLTATLKDLTWTSSDTSVATVLNGVVTPLSTGTTTIKAKVANGIEDTASIKVTVPVASVTLQSTLTLNVGDSDITLNPTILPSSATNKNVSWMSSNTKSVTVDTYGKVHAVAPGTATVTVTTQNGAITARSAVTVPTKATGVTITPSSLTFKLAQVPIALRGAVMPSTASLKALTWSSTDLTVATVNPTSGLVTPVGLGNAFIKVTTTEGVYSTIPVQVITPVSGITLNSTVTTMTYGGSDLTIIPAITPSNATIKDIIWSSSSPTIAAVNASGIVHAVNAGIATITAQTKDGNKIAKTTVTIPGVALSAEEKYLKLGSTVALGATYTNTGSIKAVRWQSSDPTIATVNLLTGLITPVKEGVVTVTAATYPGATYSDTAKVTVFKTSVTGITLNKTTATAVLGGSDLALIPTVLPTDASIAKISWTSSNPAVVTVDSNGVVHAVSPGIAIITAATSEGAKLARCTVTVTTPAASVQVIRPDSLNVKMSANITLRSTVLPPAATNKKVTWASSNSSVATVGSTTGLVATVGVGSTEITATTADGGFTDKITLQVITPVTSVTLSVTTKTLKMGSADYTLIPAILPNNATLTSVSWSSSNTAVATVDSNGLVHAVGPGTTLITVTTADGAKTARCTIIIPRPVTSVQIRHADSLNVNLGSPMTLKALILPINASDLKLTWSSSDDTVASVASTGALTTHKEGSTDIKVTTSDGGLTDTITVNVIKGVTSITLNKTAATILLGGTDLNLTANVLPSTATYSGVYWESSKPGSATVDQNGVVHAVAAGTTIISAFSMDGTKVGKCSIFVK